MVGIMNKTRNSPPSEQKKQDQLYSQPREAITSFAFDQSVVDVFEDMIGRSVPGYGTLLSMFPVISRYFVKERTRCYDLGCSLGASTLAMVQGIDQSNVSILAVDNSSAMVEKCRHTIDQHVSNVDVEVRESDVCELSIENASMVVMNFTLQFIEESLRPALIKTIFDGMNEAGVFILSEKIELVDTVEQNRQISLHHAFKKANGYSDLEVSQKRSALENVLVPETLEQHIARLKTAGFSEVFVWFQCFNFVSIMAIK
jgi:tRNA (cmo5U34)-methyltransferase